MKLRFCVESSLRPVKREIEQMNNDLDNSCGVLVAHGAWTSPSEARDCAGAAPPFEAFSSRSPLALDLRVLQHVSYTMGMEAQPAKRVGKLLEAAVQSTKATWGLVAIAREGGWEAAACARQPERTNIGAKREIDRLPASILKAAARLSSALALYDARADRQWRSDDYVRCRKPRSVLCVPIRCGGTSIGALYLEHEAVPGLFTPTAVALVEMIALQTAFALENARLHDELSAQHARLRTTEARMRDALSELDRTSRLSAYGELAASIVHEVAQPVAALDTSARAGLKWLDRSAPNIDAAREMLAHICACAMRTRTIIDALRAKARQTAPVFAAFDLADALREASEFVTCTLEAMNVSLRLEGLSSPMPVLGDRVQLQQAVISLLMNGAEAMIGVPGTERALLLTGESDRGARGCVRICIDDRGEGFDPRLAQRIFEPLFTTKPHGMGMGLSICKSIVEAHNGQLQLIPRSEGGTRATITLPGLPD